MGCKKGFFGDFHGTVTILTDDRVIFQGELVGVEGNRHDSDPDCCDPIFIIVRLECDPALIRDDARIRVIEPHLFERGDVISINVEEIIAVGPSRCCFGEHHHHDDDE